MAIRAQSDTKTLKADGRDIAHIEIRLEDANNILNPVAANAITVKVEGAAELLALDNGMPDSHESFKSTTMNAAGGFLLAIIRAKQTPGSITIKITAKAITPATVELKASGNN